MPEAANAKDFPRKAPQESQKQRELDTRSALFDSKGRVRRDHVMIEARDEVHSEGSYYLDGGMAESDIARARGQRFCRRGKSVRQASRAHSCSQGFQNHAPIIFVIMHPRFSQSCTHRFHDHSPTPRLAF